ncbi:hypothetical protein GOV10_05290 [Candidatus Woesearchaeota archaeon]|nr:hypothetical protein [Candidatus Woesearchaeota archaeon]
MCKKFIKWVEKALKKFEWYDISLIKLTTAAFVLMIAKFWNGLLALDWYWYLIIGLVAAVHPMKAFCNKKKK